MQEAGYRQLGGVVRAHILKEYGPASCIATTRATVDVLRKRHIDVFPLAVYAVVVNTPVMEWARENGRFPVAGTDEYPPNGYALSIGSDEQRPEQWKGHLVAIAERKWLLDYSIDQANRAKYGLFFEPLVVPIDEAFLRGRSKVVYEFYGSFVYYQAIPGDKTFKASPNWEGERAPKLEVVSR